ncbi:MAG: hypothetical protein IT445_19840 [Phycisphaeraceae bacterium]|nr:hypothetical protein [Phycisphaeraceae bacterium]
MFKITKPTQIAAGLTLAAALTPGTGHWVHATVVNVPLNLVYEDAQGVPNEVEFNLDIDGDGLVDVDFFVNGSFGASARGGFGGGSSYSSIIRNNTADPVVRNLDPGATVDLSQIADGFDYYSGGYGRLYFLGGPADMEFLDGVPGYMGLLINNNTGAHFGWMKLMVEKDGVRVGVAPNDDPGARLTIFEAAYEADPGVAIQIPLALHPGDANGDGMVNLSDLQILGDNWQSTTATWAEADFTGDNNVNLADLQILGDNWGYGASPDVSFETAMENLAIPEPASLIAISLCSPFMLRRRLRSKG